MGNSEKSSPKPGGHSKLYAAIGVAAIVVGFFLTADLAGFVSGKKDFTEDKIYTLSETTQSLLADLPVEVKLRYYVSSDEEGLPPQIRSYADRFWDFLQEYERLAEGKLKIERLHPSPDTDEEDSAISDGVYPAVNPFSRDSYYFSLALSSLGQNATIRVDQVPEQTLEFLLTKTILEISTLPKSKPKLTVVSSLNLQDDSFLFSELAKRYTINYVDPTESTLVKPEEAEGDSKVEKKQDPELVIVVHPHDITPVMEYEIDQYLLRGGKVLAFVDPAHYFAPRGGPPQFQGMPPTPGVSQKSDLPNLFKSWGINYSPNKYIADATYKTRIWLPDETPVVLTLSNQAINKDDPVLSQIQQNTIAVLAGALGGKAPKGVKREVLLESSTESKLITDSSDPYVQPHGSTPEPTLRILDADANKALVTGFQASVPKVIPTTANLHVPGIVGEVSRLDIPRRLVITTVDAEGDDLAGSVMITGTDAKGTMINEEVPIKAGQDVQLTNNVFASVGSVSHDFGKTAQAMVDTLNIKGAGNAVQHPIAIRLTGNFSTAFPDGRPEANPLPEADATGFPPGMPNIPGLPPGLGAPGAQGEPGEGGEPSASGATDEEGVDGGEPEKAPAAPPEPGDADPQNGESPGPGDPVPPGVTDPVDPEAGGTDQESPLPAVDPAELPEVDPPKEEPQEPQIMESAKAGAVTVVADVDIINNQFTAALVNLGTDMRTGEPVQGVMQNTDLGNSSLVVSLIEQLTSDVRLLSIQSRANSIRPLTRLQEMEKQASQKISDEVSNFVERRNALRQDIKAMRSELEEKAQSNQLIVQEGEAEIEARVAELVSIQKQIREMEKAKKAEEKNLVAQIKAWNIAAIPVLVIFVGLGIAVSRRFITAAR